MQNTVIRGGARGLLGAGLLALTSTGLQAQNTDTETYVRASEGAQVRVFQDANAKALGPLAAGDLLRVHRSDVFDLPDGRKLTWHEVSSPRGFPVWVYAEYLAATGAEGVYAVTGNAVRMRPMPESSISSYPLRTTLSSGDRVQLIEDGGEWMKVWSPSTAQAWVNASETTPEADMAAARTAWAKDLRVLANAPIQAAKPEPAGSTGGGASAAEASAPATKASDDPRVPGEAYRSLNYGNTLLENARKKGKAATEADFQPAIRAYDVVLDMAPAGTQVADTAMRQKELAMMLQQVAALRDELNQTEVDNEQRLRKLRDQQYASAVADTTSWGRFTGRGWVESVTKGKQVRWYLRWAGDVVYEVECGSGRYDLSMFEGYQIGVVGSMARGATSASDRSAGEVAMLDISSIEVIDGGRRR